MAGPPGRRFARRSRRFAHLRPDRRAGRRRRIDAGESPLAGSGRPARSRRGPDRAAPQGRAEPAARRRDDLIGVRGGVAGLMQEKAPWLVPAALLAVAAVLIAQRRKGGQNLPLEDVTT